MGRLPCCVLLSCFAPLSLAQKRDRDPMTDAEVDQMREAADYPNKRLELMVRFAKERIAMIDLLRTDPDSAATRPKQIHDLLQDFITLLDETDDNIDMYDSHHADMRKGLKLVIEANSEWQLKLRQLKEQSPPDELQQYSFVLANALDTVAIAPRARAKPWRSRTSWRRKRSLTRITRSAKTNTLPAPTVIA